MKILLIGEYSRLHNSLKEGLLKLSHEVTLINSGDGFKDFASDYTIKKKYTKGIQRKIKNLIFFVFGFDLESFNIYQQIKRYFKNTNHNFDVVQFINESSFLCTPNYERKIFDIISSKGKKVFLLSCGYDYNQIEYALKNPGYLSVLTPLHTGKLDASDIPEIMKYQKKSYKKLSHYIYKKIDGIIASDLDYTEALEHISKYKGMIPNPINCDEIQFLNNQTTEKPIVFHGINSANYYKKGNDIFEASLKKLKIKYPKIKILETRNLPYKQYIKSYKESHILLDMCYSNDQGYNALEAMCMGKVVFSGAGEKWQTYYALKEDEVVINATPNTEEIFLKLENLILKPQKISEIAINARKFVEEQHHYIKIAKKYVEVWSN